MSVTLSASKVEELLSAINGLVVWNDMLADTPFDGDNTKKVAMYMGWFNDEIDRINTILKTQGTPKLVKFIDYSTGAPYGKK